MSEKISLEKKGSSIEDLIRLISTRHKVKLSEASARLGVPKKIILQWSMDLKKRGLIDVHKPFLLDHRLKLKPVFKKGEKGTGVPGKVIAVSNQKGGVGKTITAINLASCLALLKKRTLLVYADPQGNTTSGLGIDKDRVSHSLYDSIIRRKAIGNVIIPTGIQNLDLIPSSMDLAGAEIELVGLKDRERKIKHAIEDIKDRYDFILIDCPPSLGLLTINSLVAADSVLIPVQCEYYALEGVARLIKTIDLVKKRLNRNLEIEGILLTMYDEKTKHCTLVASDVRRHFGSHVYTTIIPRTIKLSEAPSFGKPIIHYDPMSTGADAYMKLTKEIIKNA